jgi:cytochrome c
MGSRIKIALVLFLLVALISIVAAEKGDPQKGKELFASRCAACHGSSGEGKEAIGKMFGVAMPPLGSKQVQALDDAALRKVILQGKGKMKPVNLSDQEATDVIAFLRTLKK